MCSISRRNVVMQSLPFKLVSIIGFAVSIEILTTPTYKQVPHQLCSYSRTEYWLISIKKTFNCGNAVTINNALPDVVVLLLLLLSRDLIGRFMIGRRSLSVSADKSCAAHLAPVFFVYTTLRWMLCESWRVFMNVEISTWIRFVSHAVYHPVSIVSWIVLFKHPSSSVSRFARVMFVEHRSQFLEQGNNFNYKTTPSVERIAIVTNSNSWLVLFLVLFWRHQRPVGRCYHCDIVNRNNNSEETLLFSDALNKICRSWAQRVSALAGARR